MEWKKLLTQVRLKEEKKDPESFDDYYISPFELFPARHFGGCRTRLRYSLLQRATLSGQG